MRHLSRALIGALMFMLPFAATAKDVALMIANIDQGSFSQKSKFLSELGSVQNAYRDSGYTVLTTQNIRTDEFFQVLRTFEAESRDADRVVIHFVGPIVRSPSGLSLRAIGHDASSIVSGAVSSPSIDLIYALLAHRPGRAALVLGTMQDKAVELVFNHGGIPNGVMVLIADGGDINRITRNGFLAGGESGVTLNERQRATVLGFVSDQPMTRRGAVTAPAPELNASQAALIEMDAWRAAAQNGSAQALESYLTRYPRGIFAGEAQARLDALRPVVPLEQTIEDALQLSRSDRRQIQSDLTLMGFSTRGVDGVLGRGSRAAIERWQRSEGLAATGFLNASQIRLLRQSARDKAQADKAKRDQEDLAYWQSTGAGARADGAQAYLEKYPDGLFADQAKAALARLEQNTNQQRNEAAARTEQALGLNRQTRTLAEQRLAGLGYKTGPVDGNFTRETRISIRQFQQKSGLPATGFLDNQTVTRLVASIFR